MIAFAVFIRVANRFNLPFPSRDGKDVQMSSSRNDAFIRGTAGVSAYGTSLCSAVALRGVGRTSGFHRQEGAAALEFALIFPLFFVLFYAIVAYSLVMTLEQSLTHAAAEGARAAVAVDPAAFDDAAAYGTKINDISCAVVSQALNWLSVPIDCAAVVQSGTVTVTLTYPYADDPLVPVLIFPGFGKIPDISDSLVAHASAQL